MPIRLRDRRSFTVPALTVRVSSTFEPRFTWTVAASDMRTVAITSRRRLILRTLTRLIVGALVSITIGSWKSSAPPAPATSNCTL